MDWLKKFEGYFINLKKDHRELKYEHQRLFDMVSLQIDTYSQMKNQYDEICSQYDEISNQLKDLRHKQETLELTGRFVELGDLPEHIKKLENQLETIRSDMRMGREKLEAQLDRISDDVVELLNHQQLTDEFLQEKLMGNWKKLKKAWRMDKRKFVKEGIKMLGPQFLKLIGLIW